MKTPHEIVKLSPITAYKIGVIDGLKQAKEISDKAREATKAIREECSYSRGSK